MALRLLGQTSIFGVVFFVFKSLLGTERQKKLKNYISQFSPKSHGVLLEYWYVERGLSVIKEDPLKFLKVHFCFQKCHTIKCTVLVNRSIIIILLLVDSHLSVMWQCNVCVITTNFFFLAPELPVYERRNWLIHLHFIRKEYDKCMVRKVNYSLFNIITTLLTIINLLHVHDCTHCTVCLFEYTNCNNIDLLFMIVVPYKGTTWWNTRNVWICIILQR